ncbi:hypothetical protein CIB84_005684, partial [Bambusicola thoracicus]
TLGNEISVTLYSPPLPEFDCSMVVIFVIAVFTVALGAYWSGVAELENLKATASPGDREPRRKKEENVTFTTLTVVLFVVICCVMLILLYFFYKWLVYVIILVFCLASAMSLYNCLAALIGEIPFGQCRIVCGNRNIEVRLIFLAAFCIAAAAVWAVFRNEDRWAWILQDILGIAFCLNFIKTLKMPNFKSCVILLGLLLLYDVFFVFITPFITKNGASIMVEVAAGPFGNSEKNDGNLVEVPAERSAPHEKLPVVIRVPRLEYSAATLCDMPFSLLGFGDIIVPGLLVAYCRRFDVQTSSSSVYYVSCTIAYAIGMVLTFVVLALMKMGQPALLYLVPCTLITSSLVAWRRKEMKKFWKGSSYQVGWMPLNILVLLIPLYICFSKYLRPEVQRCLSSETISCIWVALNSVQRMDRKLIVKADDAKERLLLTQLLDCKVEVEQWKPGGGNSSKSKTGGHAAPEVSDSPRTPLLQGVLIAFY